jgi:glutathione S-transferase
MNDNNSSFDINKIAPITIYDWHTGPYPARVRIALAEKNFQSRVRFQSINLWKGEHKEADFLLKNYSGTLPVLQLEDGTFIAECLAITQYLDALDGDQILTGKSPIEKGLIHMMSKRAELELIDAVSIYFHHATPGLGPKVELYQNAEWGMRQRDKALRGMHYFNTVLKTQEYIAGKSFSMADITVIGGLIFAELVDLEIPAECETLKSWYARMNERPSVKSRISMSAPNPLQ